MLNATNPASTKVIVGIHTCEMFPVKTEVIKSAVWSSSVTDASDHAQIRIIIAEVMLLKPPRAEFMVCSILIILWLTVKITAVLIDINDAQSKAA